MRLASVRVEAFITDDHRPLDPRRNVGAARIAPLGVQRKRQVVQRVTLQPGERAVVPRDDEHGLVPPQGETGALRRQPVGVAQPRTNERQKKGEEEHPEPPAHGKVMASSHAADAPQLTVPVSAQALIARSKVATRRAAFTAQ